MGQNASSHTHWRAWIQYTTALGIDPSLEAIKDKIPILQVFLHQVREGALARNVQIAGPPRSPRKCDGQG
jgi:hypothetical protein